MKTKTRFHKLTAWLLTVAMLMTFIPCFTLSASAADSYSYPTSTPTTTWTGSGTEDAPYVIDTAQELADFAYLVNNSNSTYGAKSYKLGANIDLENAEWMPIGISGKPFKGSFDGGGFSVTNLKIENPTQNSVGLFGLTIDATFKNLTVYGNVSGAKSFMGGIVGHIQDGGTISNCVNYVNVTNNGTSAYGTGGIIGQIRATVDGAPSGKIIGCKNYGAITGGNVTGGIAGGMYGTVENCINEGIINGNGITGGVCGTVQLVAGTDSFTNCSNIAAVSGKSRVGSFSYGGNTAYGVGGVCGAICSTNSSNPAVMSKCFNTGKVTNTGTVNTSSGAGGVIGGGIWIKLDNCYNAGEVVSAGSVGGIVGIQAHYTSLVNCHNYGAITTTAITRAGGISGYRGNASIDIITNCYYVNTNLYGSSNSSVYDIAGQLERKLAAEFADGTVYNLLQDANGSTQVWGQTIGTDNYPVFFNGSNVPKPAHEHRWSYIANDTNTDGVYDTINAVCSNADNTCSNPNGGSVTIAAPASLDYTGEAIEAVVTNNLVDTTVAVNVVYTEASGSELTEGKPVKVGTYTASITLGGATASVEYSIAPTPAQVELEATKEFNDWGKVNSFTFNLTAVGNAPLPASTTAVATEDAPTVSFGTITYETEGTYKYVITEVNDNITGITYDSTEHEVVVTVTKGADNKLSAVVTYDGKNTLIITNTYTQPTVSISVEAVDIENGNALAGAHLQLRDSAGDVVVIDGTKVEWDSTNGAYEIEGLTTDKDYTITVTAAPTGYIVSGGTEFRIDSTLGLITTGTVTGNGVILIKLSPTIITVSAVDIADGEALSGATIRILDEQGIVVEEWVSATEVHQIKGLKIGEEYTLKAQYAPQGYTIPNDTKITISEQGLVSSTGTVIGNGVLLVELEKITNHTVTVTADPTEGGSVAGGGTYAKNTFVTVTATANDGYKFDGWYEDGIFVSDNESYTFKATENCELTAEFAMLYTITYHANNGTGATDNESVADGDTIGLTSNVFTYGKCEIESWNTEADGSGYIYNVDEDITVTEDIALYAQWVLPLNRYAGFSEGDYEWSGNTASPYNFTMKNGAILYASIIFPTQTNNDKGFFTVEDNCEIKGSVSFVCSTGMSGTNLRGNLTIKGDGTLKFRELSATGSGDTLAVETDVTIEGGVNIGASGGSDSKIVIKDATLTLHDNLTLLQYLTMEGEAKIKIINATASFYRNPEITLGDKAEIHIGGNGFSCVLYKEKTDGNEAFDWLVNNGWLPEGYSFREYNNGYYLYDDSNNLVLNSIIIKKPGHTVTFVDWDGNPIDTQAVNHGSAATAPANPTREGYTFTGWDKAFDNVTGDLTVTAQYVKQEGGRSSSGGGGVSSYTVKFDANGGTAVANKTVTRNSKVAEPTAPTKDGFTFEGWYTDKELTTAYDFDTKVTKSLTLYAKWSESSEVDNPSGGHNCPSLKFSDLDITKWYHLDTDYVIENGIFKGATKTTFEPDSNITRGMMITVLYRAEGEPEVTGDVTFEDVDENAYYAKAVAWGQQNGIIKGYSETEYAPEQNILREQIAAIMHRYAKFKEYDVSVGENTNILSYSDYDKISEYAVPAMQWAVGSGMIKGRTESTLNPEAFATRVEIAAMLHRFIETH